MSFLAKAVSNKFTRTAPGNEVKMCCVIAGAAMLLFAAPVKSFAANDFDTCEKASGDVAIAACTRAIGSHRYSGDNLAELYYNRGVEYDNQGDHDRAIADYTEAMRLDPRNGGSADIGGAYNDRGDAYQAKGDYDRAIADYNEAIRLNPKYAKAYDNRGDMYKAKGDLDHAIADYSEAIRLDPKNAAYENDRGNMYYDKGDYDRAITDYSQAIRLGPKDGMYETNRGNAYQAKGDYDRALADYTQAIRLNSKYALAYVNRGVVYYNKGDSDRAFADYDQAIQIDPNSVRQKVIDLYWAGKFATAIPLAKHALTIAELVLGPDDPTVSNALFWLGNVYREQGLYAEAEPLYKRALAIGEKALGTDHPDVTASLNVSASLNGLAWLYNEQGRYSKSEPLYKRELSILEKALPEHGEFALALHNLAEVYRNQGRYAEAEPLYRRALVIEEKAYGPESVYVARSLHDLAALYLNEGRYADAEPLSKQALSIVEKVLSPGHPGVALGLISLATLYRDQGRYADAESLYKRALDIGEKAVGPDHPGLAEALNNLAGLYRDQGRYAEAEPLLKRSLAIREKALGPDHPDVAASLNTLALLYGDQHRYGDALPLIRRTIAQKRAVTWAALPVLSAAKVENLVTANEALDESLNVVQRASQTSAGEALNALAVRFSAGSDRLAELVRKDQDLASEAAGLDKAIITAVSKEPSKRDPAAEGKINDRIATIAKERDDLGKTFAQDFPDYAALSRPEPLRVNDIQPLLAGDEALVIVHLDEKKSYAWALTRNAAEWQELAVTSKEATKAVSALRSLLGFDTAKPFDPQASFALYQEILAPLEDLFGGKPRLSLVLDGALSSLPPQLLVTRDPTGKELKDVDWLIRTHAVTVLPSVASLKVLRGKSTLGDADKPLIGFADPVFEQQNVRVAANVTASRGIRGSVADIAELRTALPPLPETADELKKVAASVHANPADIFLGPDATETRVKEEKLDQYRVVYFATHGLLAGDVADFAKLNAEPALVLSLPEHPTEFDDGLLTASEVAQLKLNADWVVLSACNTASAEKPGAEALSGLARAFFYAGARSLIVSNWEVNSDSAVTLMTGTFAALAADPKLSHAEALRKSMLAMIDNPEHPQQADPKYWAPFVVVGEPAKPSN